MSEATKKAAEWWSDPQSEAPETQWVRVPGVVENMNRRGLPETRQSIGSIILPAS
jgi:hypothetical protein